MKKITNRAVSVLLIAALIIVGMVVYVLRYVDEGRDWALPSPKKSLPCMTAPLRRTVKTR